MLRKSLTAAFAFMVVLLAPHLWAETVKYPEKNPLFTIEAPEGWKVFQEPAGPLTIQNEDVSVVAVFDGRVKGVKDVATAKEAVAFQIKMTSETTGFTDLKAIKPVQPMQLNERIDGVGAQYHAKFPNGEPCIYLVIFFAPNGTDYCSMEISVKVRGLTPAVEKEWKAMIDSIESRK